MPTDLTVPEQVSTSPMRLMAEMIRSQQGLKLNCPECNGIMEHQVSAAYRLMDWHRCKCGFGCNLATYQKITEAA